MVLQLMRLSCSPAARASPCASRARSANHALRARTVLYEHARIQAARRIVPEQSNLGRSLLMSGRCCRAHDDVTGNQWICLEHGLRCIVLLSNDVRNEAAYPKIVRAVLGDTGMPWSWEYAN
jgi:hypothetical protein